jgi:hypothetical protein
MRARYPDTEGFIERDGVKVGYEVFGEGTPAVVFPPVDPIVQSQCWKAQVPYLARATRVITIDPRSTLTAGSSASRYACRVFRMTPGPRTPRSLLTSVATFCRAAVGGSSAHSTSTILSSGTSPGRSTASSLSSVRDLRLPSSPSESSVPSRTTPNVPARRSSTRGETPGPGGISLPTSTSYRWPAAPGKSSWCGFRGGTGLAL